MEFFQSFVLVVMQNYCFFYLVEDSCKNLTQLENYTHFIIAEIVLLFACITRGFNGTTCSSTAFLKNVLLLWT